MCSEDRWDPVWDRRRQMGGVVNWIKAKGAVCTGVMEETWWGTPSPVLLPHRGPETLNDLQSHNPAPECGVLLSTDAPWPPAGLDARRCPQVECFCGYFCCCSAESTATGLQMGPSGRGRVGSLPCHIFPRLWKELCPGASLL